MTKAAPKSTPKHPNSAPVSHGTRLESTDVTQAVSSSASRSSRRPRPCPAPAAPAAAATASKSRGREVDISTKRLLDDPESADERDDDNEIIIHPGRASEGDTLPGLDPLTPRTPSKVRFNLEPEIAPTPKTAKSPEERGEDATDVYEGPRGRFSQDEDDRASLDFEDDPMYAPWNPPRGPGEDGDHQHRRPLLTDVEAPAVTLANSLGGMSDEEVAERLHREHHRPRSGMKAAFMNMANSIIGAGIIGQPYAFKQAGLIAGLMLLVGLTVIVDWTVCLIVLNSKLSGRDSFQGTVEHCFGRKGLIAISWAQWLFAFGGMVAFGVIIGDSIPHVLSALWPNLGSVPVLGILANRRAVISLFILGISLPLTLYRDIAKVYSSSDPILLSVSLSRHTSVLCTRTDAGGVSWGIYSWPGLARLP